MADTKIRVSMVMDASQLTEGLKAAGTSIEELGKKTTKTNGMLGEFGTWLKGRLVLDIGQLCNKALELGKALIDGIANGVKECVNAFAGFEKSMRNVNSIAQESEEGFKKTSKAVLDLAVELGKDPTGLADALFDINSAGVAGKEGMDLLKESARLAEAGLTDTKTAAGGLLTTLALYKDEVGNAANAADVFSKANEIGRTTIGELSKEFGRVATSAKTAGVSFKESMAAMAALTLAGQETNLAATNLNATFTEIIKPSEKLAAVFKEVTGQSIQTYTAQNGLSGALKALMEITGGSTEQLGKLGLSQSSVAAIAGLATNNFKTFDDAMKSLGNSAGTVDKQLGQQTMSLAKVQERWEAVKKVVMIEIGEKMAPILGMIVGYVLNIAEAFRAWLDNKDNVAELSKLVDACKVAILYMVDAAREMMKAVTLAFGTTKDGANESKAVISSLIGVVKLLAVGFRMVLEFVKPLINAIAGIANTLGAIADGRWKDALIASFNTAKNAALDTSFALVNVAKVGLNSFKEMADAEKELSEMTTQKAEADAARKANAERVAQEQMTASAAAGSEQRKHFAAVDVDATIEAIKQKEKAETAAQGKSLKTAKETSQAQIGFAQDLAAKTIAALGMIPPVKGVQIKGSVTGLDGITDFRGGSLEIKGTGFFVDLEKMLKATVHRDLTDMNKNLLQIANNTAETARKIPPAATGIGG